MIFEFCFAKFLFSPFHIFRLAIIFYIIIYRYECYLQIHVMLRMFMNLMWISAMNGHTECLRLLMETAEDSNIVDCTDAYERYVLVLIIVSF